MEVLLPKLAFESDTNLSTLLLYKIVELSGLTYADHILNEKEIAREFDLEDSSLQKYYTELKNKCRYKPNYRTQRWVKKLLLIYLSETSKLDEDSKSAYVNLNVRQKN